MFCFVKITRYYFDFKIDDVVVNEKVLLLLILKNRTVNRKVEILFIKKIKDL